MTLKQFERSVSDLTKRVQKLHNGDFVALSYHSGSWHASTCFTGIRSGSQDTPGAALAVFIEALRKREVSAGEVPPIERSA